MAIRLIERLIGRQADWLTDCLLYSLTLWMIDSLPGWSMGYQSGQLDGLLVDCLTEWWIV